MFKINKKLILKLARVLFLCNVTLAGLSCLSNPCYHGICIDDINGTYLCYCIDGYTGIQCQTNWDECWSSPCLNGGTCIDGIAAYNCSCPDGFVGDNCEINYDECDSNPCMNNGTCIDLTNGYICTCQPGYVGTHCEEDIAVCNSSDEFRCANGGYCVEDVGLRFKCKCLPGWTGNKCEEQTNECVSSPCKNGGQCIDLHADYICACLYGFTGKSCEVKLEFCEENWCQNEAVCLLEDEAKVCYCVPDYHGERCQLQYNECELGPRCLNGGTCIDGVDNFTCSCPPSLTGLLCECFIQGNNTLDCSYVSPIPYLNSTSTEKYNTITSIESSSFLKITKIYSETTSDINSDTTTFIENIATTEMSTTNKYLQETTNVVSELTVATTEKWNSETSMTNNSGTAEPTSNIVKPFTTESLTTTEAKAEGKMDEMTTQYTETFTTESYTEISNLIETTFSTLSKFDTDYPQETTTRDDGIGDTSKFTEESTDANEKKTEKSIKETDEITVTPITISKVSKTSSDTKSQIDTEPTITVLKEYENFTTPAIKVESSTFPQDTTKIEIITTKEQPTTIAVITDLTLKNSTIKFETSTKTTIKPLTDFSTVSTELIKSATNNFFTEKPSYFDGDLTTVGYSDVTSESPFAIDCHDVTCKNNGTCASMSNGIKCDCPFNYEGQFCESQINIKTAAFNPNSQIIHKIDNTTKFQIVLNAKTLTLDGEILYLNITDGIYLQLYIWSGFLKFKFACGYQTMLLSELKTYMNTGFQIRIDILLALHIEQQHCTAKLKLNDTLAMSGEQIANITQLNFNNNLYLGMSPKGMNMTKKESKSFVGCIFDLKINNATVNVFSDASEAYKISECNSLFCLSSPCQNGGSCIDNGYAYKCICIEGYMGLNCEHSVCNRNPCKYGGTCIPYPGTGYLCLCPYGKHGMFCENSLEITKPYLSPSKSGISSYIVYNLDLSSIGERFEFKMKFQPQDMEQISLLAFIGQNGHHNTRSQHLAVTFVKGYLMLTWNMGEGPRRIFTPRPISDLGDRGHWLQVGRVGRTAWLSVDGRFNVSGNAAGKNIKMNYVPRLYVGGHPSYNFMDLPHDLPLHSGWRGCVWGVNARVIGGTSIGQCGLGHCSIGSCNGRGVCINAPATYRCICNHGWFGSACQQRQNQCYKETSKCNGYCVITASGERCDCPYGTSGINCQRVLYPSDVLFTGKRSFVKLKAFVLSSAGLSIEAEIKPMNSRGLIFFAKTDSFSTSISMEGGLLEFRWIDTVSSILSIVRSSIVVPLNNWHNIKAGRYGSRVYIWVDSLMSIENMAARTYPHNIENSSINIGGVNDLSMLPLEIMNGPPEYFKGCFRNLHINNVFIPLEKENIVEGLNLKDCDGDVCGNEICSGEPCSIRDGVPTCMCGSYRTGNRCRRHLHCTNCTNIVSRKIIIPQFNGDSLMMIDESDLTSSIGNTQSENIQFYDHNLMAFNFTTIEADGMLVFILKKHHFISAIMNEGFLHIILNITHSVLPLFNNTKTYEDIKVPQAGFLADGEWHTVRIWIDINCFEIYVDNKLVYNLKPGVNINVNKDKTILYLGSIPNNVQIPDDKNFKINFKGCIDDLSTSNVKTFKPHFSQFYMENIQSCNLITI